jgi:hypothetical protein
MLYGGRGLDNAALLRPAWLAKTNSSVNGIKLLKGIIFH